MMPLFFGYFPKVGNLFLKPGTAETVRHNNITNIIIFGMASFMAS